MKKKILALCLVVVLAVTAVTGVTLAYFTDTDIEENVFTIGNVEIELDENYVQNSQLMPGIKVVKEAWIENKGTNNAYVWAEVLVPKILDDGVVNEPTAPGLQNSLHINYPGAYAKEYAQKNDKDAKYYNENLSQLWVHKYEDESEKIEYGYLGVEEIGGVEYNKYVKLYTEILKPGEKTSNFISNVYMDKLVKQCADDECECEGEGFILYDGKTCYTGAWNVIVRGYAIQEQGFEDTKDDDGNVTEAAYVKAYKAFDGQLLDREQEEDLPWETISDPAEGGEGN